MAIVDVKKLENYKFDGVKKIIRVGVEPHNTKKSGKMFILKYMIHSNKGVRMIGFTSRNKTFKELIHYVIFTKKLSPGLYFEFKNSSIEISELTDIIKLVSTAKKSTKKNNIKESQELMNEGTRTKMILKNIKDEWGGLNSDAKAQFVVLGVWFGLIGFLLALPLIIRAINVFKSVSMFVYERHISGPAEQKINEQLFTDQDKNDSRYAIFSNLQNYVEHLITKDANGLVIFGPPGMSKTYTIRRTLYFNGLKPRKNYNIAKGSSLGLQSTFDLLYENRKKLLILDDFDSPLKDPDIVNLLKAALDTYSKRILTLAKEKLTMTADETRSATPNKFEFKGQIIIVTNLDRDEIDKALISRAPAIRVSYNGKEILDYTKAALEIICKDVDMDTKMEVYQYISKIYQKNNKIELSFRNIQNAINARVGNPFGWKEMVHTIIDYKGSILESKVIDDIHISSYLSVLKECVANY